LKPDGWAFQIFGAARNPPWRDEPRCQVPDQPVEALKSVNLVGSRGHIGSIADFGRNGILFAEISAGGGRNFGRSDARLRMAILASRLNPDFYQQVGALPMSS